MIEIEERTLMSFLYKAKEKAIANGTPQLFSWTKELKPVNTLAVFRAARKTNKNRIYWMNHDKDFSIVGIGEAKKLVVVKECEDRFLTLQKYWKETMENAIVHDPYKISGTGLVGLGGMKFDPKRPETSLWENYPDGRLTIPSFVVVQSKEKYFLTVNYELYPDEFIPDIISYIEEVERTIFTEIMDQDDNHLSQKIIHTHVVAPRAWKESVQKAVQSIKDNQAKKIVMAREKRITLNKQANISDLIERLLNTQPNSYIFAFEEGSDCFIGATPERLVKIESNKLLSDCIAGTAPRGDTAKEDKRITDALLQDEKNLEEHAYVVQMIKNSIQAFCDNIDIPDKPIIYPLRNLHHLYTPVKAVLKPGHTVFDIIKKLHPTPALGGLPRQAALEFIRNEEVLDRGWYGAPVGWLDSNGNSEFSVAIRSGLVQKDEVSLFAGCGVMRDSDPEMEFEETNVKFLPVLNVLEDEDESY